MNSDRPDGSTKAIPPVSLFRGLYDRVAKRLGVDPSYVSRVARGERKSAAVAQALAEEVQAIRDHLNSHDGQFPFQDGAERHHGASRDGASRDGDGKHHDDIGKQFHDGAGKDGDGAAKHDHDGFAKHDGMARRFDGQMPASRSKKSRARSRPDSTQKS